MMKEIIEEYMVWYGFRYMEKTAYRVKRSLYMFADYLCSNNVQSFQELNTKHLIQWGESLKARGLHHRTLNSYYSSVKGLLDWMYAQAYFLVNPWPGYLQIKRVESVPRAVPGKKETLRFFHELQEEMHNPDRNRSILELCYGSGLRRGELYALNASDIRDDWLKVTGKGNKERLVPLGSQAKMWLNTYIRGERNQLLQKYNPLEEALFLNRNGNRLGIQAYSYLITYKRPKDASWTLHSFRHACATHMLGNGEIGRAHV